MDYSLWLAERLAQLRMEKGVSARDMSLSLGQSESYINKIENHRAMPSMVGFFYICEYLGIQPRDFFDMDVPSPVANQELIQALNRLSPEKAAHILQVIRDLAE